MNTAMADRAVPLKVKVQVVMLLVLSFHVWLFLGMVYFDRFLPPFDRLRMLLMPWKGLNTLPLQASLSERLTLMEGLLDASGRVAQAALSVTIISFLVFIMYLAIVYQQRQRRMHDNAVLELKNREIARRNEFIRYISATIGHEFKNNLGRIKRRVGLMPELSREARGRIDDNMDKLFADIDIFKRISDEREAGLVEFKNVDLREMLDGLARQFRDLASIETHACVAVPPIYAAPELLRTVFENVFDNAVKYKKPDDHLAHVLVSCTTDQDGSRRYVTISIRDQGIGMDEQQSDQCFYKGKGSGESWGQGLYFAKYVVGLHAGRIRIGNEYTAPGTGTDIIINLPFVEESLDV